MNTKRTLGLVFSAILVAAVALFAIGFNVTSQAKFARQAYAGFGDLRLFERQPVQSTSAAQVYSRAAVIGENIRRSEAQKSLLANEGRSKDGNYLGFGDLGASEQKLVLPIDTVGDHNRKGHQRAIPLVMTPEPESKSVGSSTDEGQQPLEMIGDPPWNGCLLMPDGQEWVITGPYTPKQRYCIYLL